MASLDDFKSNIVPWTKKQIAGGYEALPPGFHQYYFNKDAYGLVPSDLDEEDLDGIYFVDKSELISLQTTLCSNYGFLRLDCTEESVYEDIEVLNEKFHVLSQL